MISLSAFCNRILAKRTSNILLKTGKQKYSDVAVKTKSGDFSMPRNLHKNLIIYGRRSNNLFVGILLLCYE